MVQAAVDTGELSAHQKARASNMQGGYRHDATFVTRIVGSEFSNDLCSILLCFSIEPMVLWCFRSKMVKNQWFIVCSLKNAEKPVVLLCFRSKILKNHWFYGVFAQKC